MMPPPRPLFADNQVAAKKSKAELAMLLGGGHKAENLHGEEDLYRGEEERD